MRCGWFSKEATYVSPWEWLGLIAVAALLAVGAFAAVMAIARYLHPRKAKSGDPQGAAADLMAKMAAGLVLFAGGVFVVLPAVKHHGTLFGDPYKPRLQTTTIKHTIAGNRAAPKTTKTLVRTGAGAKHPVTRTIVTESAGRMTETTTTTGEAAGSFFERALAASGLLFLRLGLLLVAAFLAGAIVQRTLLGRFAFKLGPVEVPDLPQAAEASRDAINKIQAGVKRQVSRLANQVAMKLEQNASTTAQTGSLVAATARELSQLRERIAELEARDSLD